MPPKKIKKPTGASKSVKSKPEVDGKSGRAAKIPASPKSSVVQTKFSKDSKVVATRELKKESKPSIVGAAKSAKAGNSPVPSNRRDPRVSLAAGFMRAGDRDKAVQTYLEILSDRPGDRAAATAVARVAISTRDPALLRVAAANAVALERPMLATCVGLLIRAGEVDALTGMAAANPLSAADFIPPILRLCRTELKKAGVTRSRASQIYRAMLELNPADTGARTGLARLFDRDLAAAKVSSGKQKASASRAIVNQDPRNVAAVKLLAEASAEEGNFAEAYDALAGLDDREFTTPRIQALFVLASQKVREPLGQSEDLLRLARSGASKDAVIRAARVGIRAFGSKAPLAAINMARAILSLAPRDDKSKLFLSTIGTKLSRKTVACVRAGEVDEAEAIWQIAGEYLNANAMRAAMKLFRRNKRYQSAAAIAEQFFSENSADGDANSVLAVVFHDGGEYGKALQHALRALKATPGDEAMSRIVKYASARAVK